MRVRTAERRNDTASCHPERSEGVEIKWFGIVDRIADQRHFGPLAVLGVTPLPAPPRSLS
jgi:hypothetical protein